MSTGAITSQFIVEQIADVVRSFAPDELAYLALTSKIERPFLDRLAFAISSVVKDPGWFVAREWRLPHRNERVDIAILNGTCADTVVEGKAMVTFDATRRGLKQSEFPRFLQADLDRFAILESFDSQVFLLLLATHPLDPIPAAVRTVFKYSQGINRALEKYGSASRVREVCDSNIRRHLVPGLPITDGCVHGGIAYDVRVELLWWLIGPFSVGKGFRVCAIE
jgi:hypothetical protein